jgi:hypothetical protein
MKVIFMENRCRNGFGSAFRQESFAPNALEKLFYVPKPLQIEELTRFAELSWSSLSTWNLYSQPESGELWEGNFFRREFFMFATREVSVSVIQFEHFFFVYWNAWGALLDGGNWPDSWINSKQKKTLKCLLDALWGKQADKSKFIQPEKPSVEVENPSSAPEALQIQLAS